MIYHFKQSTILEKSGTGWVGYENIFWRTWKCLSGLFDWTDSVTCLNDDALGIDTTNRNRILLKVS